MVARQIVQGVYVVPLGPVNVFLLESNDGLLLVDTGTPGSAGQILQAVDELGRGAGGIRHILVTHYR